MPYKYRQTSHRIHVTKRILTIEANHILDLAVKKGDLRVALACIEFKAKLGGLLSPQLAHGAGCQCADCERRLVTAEKALQRHRVAVQLPEHVEEAQVEPVEAENSGNSAVLEERTG